MATVKAPSNTIIKTDANGAPQAATAGTDYVAPGVATVGTIIAGSIKPASDSTTAVQIQKAVDNSPVVNVDTSNGRVGIGTTSPIGQLDVYKTSSALSYVRTANHTLKLSADDVAGNTSIFNTAGTPLEIGTLGSTASLTLSTNGTSRLFVNSSGNVGIGTTSPVSQLSVVSATQETGFTGNAAATLQVKATTGPNDYSSIAFSSSSNYPAAKIAYRQTANGGYMFFGTTNNYGAGITNTAMSIDYVGNVGINTTAPGSKLEIKGAGLTSASSSLNVTNSGGTSMLYVRDDGNVGVGTTSPIAQLTQKSTAALESAPLGSELLSASNWTATDWTGDFATGFTHTAGNTTALTNTLAAVTNNYYQIAYTVTGRTAGSFTIAFGGESNSSVTATGTWGPKATSTGALSITPTSDFNGTIVVSIKQNTGTYNPTYALLDNTGTATLEIRSSGGALGNTFVGKSVGTRNTTGYNNTAAGLSSLLSNTTGYHNTATGASSLWSNTTGYNNTAAGASSLWSNTTGYNNTAAGLYSLLNNTTGTNNTATGVNAGRYIANGSTAMTTGTTSVYLGADTKANADGESNQIVIGYNAIGAGSNTATLGNTSITKTILRGGVITKPPATALTLANGEMTWELTSDTSLKIFVKGNDGTLRSATITLA